jgi:hypothetical protein
MRTGGPPIPYAGLSRDHAEPRDEIAQEHRLDSHVRTGGKPDPPRVRLFREDRVLGSAPERPDGIDASTVDTKGTE